MQALSRTTDVMPRCLQPPAGANLTRCLKLAVGSKPRLHWDRVDGFKKVHEEKMVRFVCAIIAKQAPLQTTSVKPRCHTLVHRLKQALIRPTSVNPKYQVAVHSSQSGRCVKAHQREAEMPCGCARFSEQVLCFFAPT